MFYKLTRSIQVLEHGWVFAVLLIYKLCLLFYSSYDFQIFHHYLNPALYRCLNQFYAYLKIFSFFGFFETSSAFNKVCLDDCNQFCNIWYWKLRSLISERLTDFLHFHLSLNLWFKQKLTGLGCLYRTHLFTIFSHPFLNLKWLHVLFIFIR